MRIISNIRVGKPDTEPDLTSHTKGVKEGNEPGNFESTPGLYWDAKEGIGKGTAQRSTGINPDSRNPIDPRMPNLPPP